MSESPHSTSKNLSQEKIVVSSVSDDGLSPQDAINVRKLMRKIDRHVVPWLAVLYLLNFLDRGNIGNARVDSSRPISLEYI